MQAMHAFGNQKKVLIMNCYMTYLNIFKINFVAIFLSNYFLKFFYTFVKFSFFFSHIQIDII